MFLPALAWFISASAILAAADPRRTVAVVSADVGASGALVDQLIAKLSEDHSLRLVEREAIARVVKEQELSALGLETSARVNIGHLIGADVLVLVGKDALVGEEGARILVCDSATGTRMGQIRVALDSAGVNALTDEIRAILARFPRGVQSAVAVPDLVCRDLGFEYAGLQTGIADLLREALSQEQGLAVVELEEAKAIAQEKSLTGGDVRRITPLFVEGEYRTDAQDFGGPKIAIKLTLRSAQQNPVKLESGSIPIPDASHFILQTAKSKVLELLTGSSQTAFNLSQEFGRLTGRAGKVAEIGDFERSAALREAALLLQPDADNQRIQLARDYIRWNQHPVEVWPKGATHAPTDPYWSQVVAHSRELWRRSLFHVEFLVRNHRVDMETGAALFTDSIYSITGIRPLMARSLKEEEDLKKEFMRNVAPLLFTLAPVNRSPAAQLEQRADVAKAIYKNVFFRIDGFLTEEDLLLLGDLLCERLPEDLPVSMELLYRLTDGTSLFTRPGLKPDPQPWLNFTQRLLRSPRPMVHAYGCYADIRERRIRFRESSDELLAEARSLTVALSEPPLAQLDPDKKFYDAAHDEVGRITYGNPNEYNLPVTSPASLMPRKPEGAPIPQPDGSILCERVRLKPITVLVPTAKNQSMPLEKSVWRAGGGESSWKALVPAWDKTDAVYGYGVVLLVGPDHIAREVLRGTNFSIDSVVFDGQYLWAAPRSYHGVYVIDRDGTIVTHVTSTEGLPTPSATMFLHPIAPGHVLAAGSIGQARGWLATITLDHDKPRVKVFHEAIKVWPSDGTLFQQELDPMVRFEPEWIAEHRDETGKRWAFVGRQLLPLMVDLETLEVSVYPARSVNDEEWFPRKDRGENAFWSHDGLFYVAGSNNDFRAFHFDPQTHRFKTTSAQASYDWHYGNDIAGSLASDQSYLYYVGDRRWLRYDLNSAQSETLVASPRSLPDYGTGGSWALAFSKVDGLVAWHDRRLFQVTIEPETKN